MGYSAKYIIPRFVKYAGMPDGYEPGVKPWTTQIRFPDGSGSSLIYEHTFTGGQNLITGIQSYGSWFPLARLLLTKSGKRKLWLLNGDRWPGGGFGQTNAHNDIAREAVQATGDKWFIVPFSACIEAGIDTATIRPVHVEPETYTYEERSASTWDDVPLGERKHRVYRDQDGNVLIPPRGDSGAEAIPGYTGGKETGWVVSYRSAIKGWQRTEIPGPAYETITENYEDITPGDDGRYHWLEERHWLGQSLFRAKYTQRGHAVRDKRGRAIRYTKDKQISALFVCAFDYNERWPLWFMSELPHGTKARTVTEAIDALKPDTVREAEAYGEAVQRQGDVFAIPMPATVTTTQLHLANGADVQGRGSRGSKYVLGTNHAASKAIVLPDGTTYAMGKLFHRPTDRRPDHQTITLGDGHTWYRLVTNTVPRSFDNGAVTRSWSRNGDVD